MVVFESLYRQTYFGGVIATPVNHSRQDTLRTLVPLARWKHAVDIPLVADYFSWILAHSLAAGLALIPCTTREAVTTKLPATQAMSCPLFSSITIL